MKDTPHPSRAIAGQSVIVVGAGIVGGCTALDLLRRGARVTLIDRREPGRETSYGNAGVLARSSLVPLNNPAMLRDLPGLLGNRQTAVRYDLRYLLGNIGWLLPFIANARKARVMQTAAALDGLIRLSIPAHKSLIAECDQQDLLSERGWIFLYRSTAACARSGFLQRVLAQFDVSTVTLDAAGLHEIEPHLAPIFPRALWVQDSASVRDPGQLVTAYARRFVAEGGRIETDSVAGLLIPEETGSGGPGVVLDSGIEARADHVVLCLGPWGKEMLNRTGYHVPMAHERGYHRHFQGTQGTGNAQVLGRPIYDTSGGYVLSPMREGLRLTTGVELNAQDAPENHAQLDRAETAAREAIDLGPASATPPWMGARPTFPDSCPCIGALPGATGISVAFGHQHIGFATAPGTARILGDLIEGVAPPIDPAPFRPGRFIVRR